MFKMLKGCDEEDGDQLFMFWESRTSNQQGKLVKYGETLS